MIYFFELSRNNKRKTSPAYSQFILKDDHVDYYNYLLTKIDDEKSFLHLSKNLRNSLMEEKF